jgi:hypothetical protein
MSVTILYRDEPVVAPSATVMGDALWISAADLRAATGWESKPEGLCEGDRCIPVPPARRAEFLASDGRIDLATFARYLGQPVVHDDAASVWLFGTAPAARGDALRSLDAPNFTLPDLEGKLHSLTDYRGKKVLLLSWASW